MKYAAQREDGSFTGALYDALSDQASGHHARFGEVLVPVLDLVEADGTWQPVLPAIEDERATWSVSRWQARQALLRRGLLDQADDMVRATADPLIIGAWDDAERWRRDSPTIAQIAAALSLTETDIDDLFRTAMGIEA